MTEQIPKINVADNRLKNLCPTQEDRYISARCKHQRIHTGARHTVK